MTALGPRMYSQKPLEVEALQYLPGPGGNCLEAHRFIGHPADQHEEDSCHPQAQFLIDPHTVAEPGDWITRHPDGHFTVHTHAQFHALYQRP